MYPSKKIFLIAILMLVCISHSASAMVRTACEENVQAQLSAHQRDLQLISQRRNMATVPAIPTWRQEPPQRELSKALFEESETKYAAMDRVRVLIEQGANIHSCGGLFNNSVLVGPARNGNSHMVRMLLLRGSYEQEVKDKALEYAVIDADQSDAYYKTIELLLAAGADINTSSGRSLRWVVSKGNERLFKLFLGLPRINLDARDAFGRNALMNAVIYGRSDMFAQLLQAGAALSKDDKDRFLIWAARENQEHFVRLLIGMGANIRRGADAFEGEGEGCKLARYYKYDNIVKIFTDLYEQERKNKASSSVERAASQESTSSSSSNASENTEQIYQLSSVSFQYKPESEQKPKNLYGILP